MLFIGKPIGRSLMISSTQSLETVATLVVIGTRHLTILFCKNCWLAGASGRKVIWEGKSLIVSMVLVQRGRFQTHQVGKSQTKPLWVVKTVKVLCGEGLALFAALCQCKVSPVFLKTTATVAHYALIALCACWITFFQNSCRRSYFGSKCKTICVWDYPSIVESSSWCDKCASIVVILEKHLKINFESEMFGVASIFSAKFWGLDVWNCFNLERSRLRPFSSQCTFSVHSFKASRRSASSRVGALHLIYVYTHMYTHAVTFFFFNLRVFIKE